MLRVLHLFDRLMLAGLAPAVQEVDRYAWQARGALRWRTALKY